MKNQKVILYLLLFVASLFRSQKSYTTKQYYCQLCPESPGKHTMCVYGPECRLQGACRKMIQQPFEPEQKNLIVHLHNTFRSKIADGSQCKPPAANMNQLIWDEELADIAQCWANQCQAKSDICRDTCEGYVGQNFATVVLNYQPGFNINNIIKEAIQGWYDQGEHFHERSLRSMTTALRNDPSTRFYTQLAWADTKKIGCARVFYKEGSMFKCNIFCNYSPGGNIPGFPVYAKGVPTTKCENGKTSGNYTRLCNPICIYVK